MEVAAVLRPFGVAVVVATVVEVGLSLPQQEANLRMGGVSAREKKKRDDSDKCPACGTGVHFIVVDLIQDGEQRRPGCKSRAARGTVFSQLSSRNNQ